MFILSEINNNIEGKTCSLLVSTTLKPKRFCSVKYLIVTLEMCAEKCAESCISAVPIKHLRSRYEQKSFAVIRV